MALNYRSRTFIGGLALVLLATAAYPLLPRLGISVGDNEAALAGVAETPRVVTASLSDEPRTLSLPARPAGPMNAPASAVPGTKLASIGPAVGRVPPAVQSPSAVGAGVETKTQVERGSEGFAKALELLDSKDYSKAFAQAEDLPSASERLTIQWAAVQYGGGQVGFADVERFAAHAPDFISASLLQSRLEQALPRAGLSAEEILSRLDGEMPKSVGARIALAVAYEKGGEKARAAEIARSIWVENFLDVKTEKLVLDKLGGLLTKADHWARAVHLMMNNRPKGVARLTKYMSEAQTSLASARTAVSRDAKNAKALLEKVDPSMKDHPVYIFSRAQRAREAGLLETAAEWFAKAEGDVPAADVWWYERRTLVRQLLYKGKPKLAYQVAAGYRSGPEGRLVEARFHAGWIALAFLDDAEAARGHFAAMAEVASLPDSVSQANYWLGRSLLKLGDAEGAYAAYAKAAELGTVYYGLLARDAIGLKGAGLREMPKWQDSQPAFEARDVVRGVRLLAAHGKTRLAEALLKSYANKLEDGGYLALSARLAQEIEAHHLAIVIADTAEKKGIPLDLFSFPKDGLPAHALAEVDAAAVYAVTRQESRFQVNAVSSAGAMGLMQLMPATARETAAKVGVPYSKSRLTKDPSYNALLGSTYLADQLARYDGSLVLAAAAYNAGAGNANKWIKAYGDPRDENIDPVVWVELIPFQETRKYVQRVLGNYLVYRARLGDTEMTIAQALRRIPG